MWKMEVERAPADCGLQTEAYKALDAIADTGFLQCLLHSFVVAIKATISITSPQNFGREFAIDVDYSRFQE